MPLGIWDVSLADKTQDLQKTCLLQWHCLVGDPWTPQLAPGVFDPYYVQKKRMNDIFRQARSPHHLPQGQWQQQQLGTTHVPRERSLATCAQQSHHAAGCPLPGRRSFPGGPLQMPPTAGPAAELPLQSPRYVVYLASLLSSASRSDRSPCSYSAMWKVVLWIGAIQSKLTHEKFIAILCYSNSDLWLKLFFLLTFTFSSVTLTGNKLPARYTRIFSPKYKKRRKHFIFLPGEMNT